MKQDFYLIPFLHIKNQISITQVYNTNKLIIFKIATSAFHSLRCFRLDMPNITNRNKQEF
jgi:hypothetical protein